MMRDNATGDKMGTFVIIVVLAFFAIIAFVFMSSSAEAKRNEEERGRRLAELEAEKSRFDAFLNQERKNWPYLDPTKIDGKPGLIAMNNDSKTFRVATYNREDERYVIETDEQLPIQSIRSIDVNQPTKASTRVHIDRTPIAVQKQKKSTIGRALIGATVAGPVGAVVGGMSSLGSDSVVEIHETKRSETVIIKDHAVLVVGTGDFRRPVIKLAFGDNVILNQWSRRLWAARGW